MSLQASIHYYSLGGNVPTSEHPIYKNRFGIKPIPVPYYKGRSESPNEKHKRGRSESPPKRLNPIKVDIAHPTEKIGIFPDPTRRIALMQHGGMSRNEMHNMVMGSHQPYSQGISELNIRRQGAGSIHFEAGGKVPNTPASKTVLAEIPTKGVDKVPALLQSGEIVIPKKHAKKVNAMLKKEGINLPGC
jgi:hypothetical protein